MGYYPQNQNRKRLNWFRYFIIVIVGVPLLVLVGYVIDNLVGNFILATPNMPTLATQTINYVLSYSALTFGLMALTIIAVVFALMLAGFFGSSNDGGDF